MAQRVQAPPETWPGYTAGPPTPWFVRYVQGSVLHSWMVVALGLYVAQDWLPFIHGSRPEPFRLRPFFIGRLRSDHELALLLALLLAAALGSAFAAAMPANPAARRLRRGTGAASLLGFYFFWLSHAWGTMPGPSQAACLVLPVLGLLLWQNRAKPARPPKQAQRREDPWAAREITWFSRRWDHPLFLRDLRAVLRPISIRRQLLIFARGFGTCTLGLATLSLLPPLDRILALATAPMPLLNTLFFRAALFAALVAPFIILGTAGEMCGVAVRLWKNELRLNTLPQLLSSPLTSEEIVRERCRAGAAATAHTCLLAWLSAVPGLFLFGGDPMLVAQYAELLILCAGTGLLLGAMQGTFPAPLRGSYTLAGALLAWPGIILGGRLAMSLLGNWLPPAWAAAIHLLAPALAAAEVALVWAIHRDAVRELEKLRE